MYPRLFLRVGALRRVVVPVLAAGASLGALAADVELADTPLFSTYSAPGNLILALSVEWPTATTPAYPSTTEYSPSAQFLGYFDPAKCYRYVPVNKGSADKPDYSASYFEPDSRTKGPTCTSSAANPLWSGNYLNWASMQTLDAFRWVLTGGYRSVDTVDKTILTKTYAARDNVTRMPQKMADAKDLGGATPFTGASWKAGITSRVRALGTRMWVTSSNTGFSGAGVAGSASTGAVPYTGQNSYVDKNDTTNYADPAQTYELYINVKVCDAKAGLEDNCVKYGDHYKPEGLMQAYSSKLRYSAFGYYNDSSGLRDGGVMRARMKYIGPTRPEPGDEPKANSHPEWDAKTGIMSANPDPGDASATQSFAAAAGWEVAIANSGVMNYLNKFGYEARNYKDVDPVSELYYAAQRYFRGLENVDDYTSLADAGSSANAAKWLDGFPAIRSKEVWTGTGDDYGSSIMYSCQRNFILGIGDTNSHRDTNLPGSAIRSKLEPSLPGDVVSDKTVDVDKATDMVGKLEGLRGSDLGSVYADTNSTACTSRCDSYFIAGLAYDAHTGDIRKDLVGPQSIDTYWMDVLEKQIYAHKNMYWLASKYGGFEVPKGFEPYASSNDDSTLPKRSWYTNGDTLKVTKDGKTLNYSSDGKDEDERPNNYFPGNQPESMKLGLTRAFADIANKTGSANSSALSLASPNVASHGAVSYAATYDPASWTGDLVATRLTFDDNGKPSPTVLWSARDLLDTMMKDKEKTKDRKIVTCCTGDGEAFPFTKTALSNQASGRAQEGFTAFEKVPGIDKQSAADLVEYLRGNRNKEAGQKGGVYRTRAHLLGDIVNSKPVAIGAPTAVYRDTTNPGYSGFKSSKSDRGTVVYVGANDGMLHAFEGSAEGKDAGKELFAYVPSFVVGNMPELASHSYSHRYFVDATPMVFDVDMNRTGKDHAHKAKSGRPDWRSLLIGGLGKGGKGYYAIDVTDPVDEKDDESAVAKKVLWEFTDSRMGFSYGTPSVVKTRKHGWTVVLTSGYNNSDGRGWIFFVNPANGELLDAVPTPEGSPNSPLNLVESSLFIPDHTDFTADALYAGDLQGNVWRVDLTGTGELAAKKFAKLTDASGAPQPVTTWPVIQVDGETKKRYVMIGTGRLLADTDIRRSGRQSFYSIFDGTGAFGGFLAGGAKGNGAPVMRHDLQANASITEGIGDSPASAFGWYFDLPTTNGIAARVNVQPVANRGVVAFAANTPNGQVCTPDGFGDIYATTFSSGKSVLVNEKGQVMPSMHSESSVRDLGFLRVGGKHRLYASDKKGELIDPPMLPRPGKLRQMSWREVPVLE